jgi:hypothetical protein
VVGNRIPFRSAKPAGISPLTSGNQSDIRWTFSMNHAIIDS